MSERKYLIHELAEKTDVSLRTIRFYTEKGLLPEPPKGLGRYAEYSEDYVWRIELIKRLKQAHLPLDEIRDRIQHLTAEQIQEILRKEENEQQQSRKQGKGQQRALPGMEDTREIVRSVVHYANGEPQGDGCEPLLGGEVWEQIEITDGIEIRFRRPIKSDQHRKINAVLQFARRMFRE